MGSHPQQRFQADTICIIGAGPAGLACAKYLLAERTFSRIAIFEQRAESGGLWNHTPCGSLPRDQCVPQTSPYAGLERPFWRNDGGPDFVSPVYDRLETNIPRDLMGFSDLDWPQECQLFPGHEEVLEYLRRYAEDVRDLITFRTQVLDVRQSTNGRTWTVVTRNVTRDEKDEPRDHHFDAVVVANGHYSVPHIPSVTGIEEWNQAYPGSITHSKFYRAPEQYSGKKVIVVGNAASGIDIGAQIMNFCKPPMLQSQKSESYLLSESSPRKLEKREIVEYITEDRSVRFADGTMESGVDVVLYCTGYFYSYPFLEILDPPLITTGERVENTYEHIFYRPKPTLALIALNQKVIPFPLAEAQSAVIARVFSGRLALPEEPEMRSWEDRLVQEMGSGKAFHVLQFPKDADYINMLHDWAASAGEAPLPPEAANRTVVGKVPPYWTEKQYWTRQRFPKIKKAFQEYGDNRRNRHTLEDVGFDFEEWKAQEKEGLL